MRFTKSKVRHSSADEPQEKLWQLQNGASLGSLFTALEGILSGDGYVIFTGVVNMMARKCTINGRTVTPNACLSWPNFLALPL